MNTRRSLQAATIVAVAVLCAMALGLGGAQAGFAAVQTTIGDGTPASCQDNDAVNAFSAAVAAGGVIDFNCGPDPVIIEVNTSLTDQQVTVNGDYKIILSGEDLRQLFYVQAGGNLTLNDITLVDGDASSGGAIYVEQGAAVTINRSFVSSSTSSGDGGAIYNRGTLTVVRSTLGSNIAGLNGGGIFNNGGSVAVRQSYLVSNQSDSGGGIYTVNGDLVVSRSAVRSSFISNLGGGILVAGPTEISNSTFSNNRADEGGALYLIADVEIINSTFYENKADTAGAIYHESTSNATLQNSIVAGSLDSNGSFPSLNCDGVTMTTLGLNIVDDNTCLPSPGILGDLMDTDPELGIWQGSPLRAYIPLEGSPAIDYADDCPSVDQRGFPRPIGVACDVGSIEYGVQFFIPMLLK